MASTFTHTHTQLVIYYFVSTNVCLRIKETLNPFGCCNGASVVFTTLNIFWASLTKTYASSKNKIICLFWNILTFICNIFDEYFVLFVNHNFSRQIFKLLMSVNILSCYFVYFYNQLKFTMFIYRFIFFCFEAWRDLIAIKILLITFY